MSDYAYSSNYYPGCPGRYGLMTADDAIVCTRAPGHRGAHTNAKAGIRWGYPGDKVAPCSWSTCTDPMAEEHHVHVCPGSEAAKRIAKWEASNAQ